MQQTSLETIWNAYRNNLKGFLKARVGDADDVEDLLQEILIKTHNGLGSVRDETKVKSWLYSIARNVITDHYRQKGRDRSVHSSDLWYEDDTDETRLQLEKCIEPFLSALPEDSAEILRAVDVDGVSQIEYAAQHGVSYSTLKSRVQKSRSDLRSVFENCCDLTLDSRGRVSDYIPKSKGCTNC